MAKCPLTGKVRVDHHPVPEDWDDFTTWTYPGPSFTRYWGGQEALDSLPREIAPIYNDLRGDLARDYDRRRQGHLLILSNLLDGLGFNVTGFGPGISFEDPETDAHVQFCGGTTKTVLKLIVRALMMGNRERRVPTRFLKEWRNL
jgi:hypothetical protein